MEDYFFRNISVKVFDFDELDNRLLSKPIYNEGFLGEAKMSNAVYKDVHEERKQVSTIKLSLEMEFGKKSIGYMTKVPAASLNIGYIRDINIENFADKLSKFKEFYDSENLDFNVTILDQFCSDELDNIMKSSGYIYDGESLSMYIDLEGFQANQKNLDIKLNNENLGDWMLPLIGAFQSTQEITDIYLQRHQVSLERNANMMHFSLYINSVPVTSITLSIKENLARIDDLGTIPEFQGNGYGTYLMKYALSKAKDLGCRYCFLESSEDGKKLYKNLGFIELFKNKIFNFIR